MSLTALANKRQLLFVLLREADSALLDLLSDAIGAISQLGLVKPLTLARPALKVQFPGAQKPSSPFSTELFLEHAVVAALFCRCS